MRWPGKIPAGTTSNAMLMTIDLFPTLAKLIGGAMPEHKIDGLDVGPILFGAEPNEARNPHDFYYFYYENNELQAVTTGDGRWKLQLPHKYRSLAGKPAGKDGLPGKYESIPILEPELYDLVHDLGETTNVAAAVKPLVLQTLLDAAEKARADLGDTLLMRTGAGVRAPGRVE